jgi:hypothetical protein
MQLVQPREGTFLRVSHGNPLDVALARRGD